MPSPATEGDFAANLFAVTAAKELSTAKFVPRRTPGNVAVCLSGGGSRSLAAGIGQLQALEALKANGSSLLSQVRVISTVSGGGWVGIPFIYLAANNSDDDYLGNYVDPSRLTLGQLELLKPSNIGHQITSDFSIVDLAVEAVYLHTVEGVTADMLWQTIIGIHMLQPYGLFEKAAHYRPASLFSYDSASLSKYVTALNPALAAEPANLVAASPGQTRPYLVSNSGMWVTCGGKTRLAPVQSTPFATGVMSRPPNCLDANGHKVGGGGVTSFAFNSAPVSAQADVVKVHQNRQWSLTDIIGTSSAAFSAALKNQLALWSKSPAHFAAAVRLYQAKGATKLIRAGSEPTRIQACLQSLIDAADRGDLTTIKGQLSFLDAIIPAYEYWPVANVPYGKAVKVTEFADGGSLENSGIASMLAYSDVDNIIAFVNSEFRLSSEHGHVIVDDSIPPLFGFQPYDPKAGYVPYAESTDPRFPLFENNQVFGVSDFQPLLQGLWDASGAGTHRHPAVFAQKLTTLDNQWFGVSHGKSVTVLWVHLNIASDWYNSFTDLFVRAAMDTEILLRGFPHYNTLDTELSPVAINLLSNLAAWTVAAPKNVDNFISLFKSVPVAAKAGN